MYRDQVDQYEAQYPELYVREVDMKARAEAIAEENERIRDSLREDGCPV